MSKFKKQGFDVFVSEMSVISRPHLIELGNHVAIDQFVTITTQAEIGDYVHIAPCCTIIGGAEAKVIMKEHSGMAAGARVIATGADFSSGYLTNPQVPQEFRKEKTDNIVIFEKYSILGTNAVVLPGVTLAEGSVIGANSVVTKDTEPWKIYAGCPAKPIKDREKGNIEEYEKILKNRDL
jgi:acetyltransferase-like isoleucine patch superfamily enzyme